MKLYFKAKAFQVRDYLKTIWRYYRTPKFALIDLGLLTLYLFYNPYRVSRQFLQGKGEWNIHAYGETPLTTLDAIFTRANIQPGQKILELGCGRGRTVFWLALVKHCPTLGIEWIPLFVKLASLFAQKDATFRCENFLDTSFEGFDVIYLYLSSLDDESIAILAEKVPPGTKVISISYSLSEYNENIKDLDRFTAEFPWGTADVVVSIRASSVS